MSYFDGATLDEAREAIRQGCTVQSIAGKLGCSPEHLARLLGIAAAPKPVPENDEFDLWAVERLQEVL
jgi:hypothetical protein